MTEQNINSLAQLSEFQKVLKDYRPSDASIKTLNDTQIVLLVGPTASGRNTLIGLLLESGKYHYIVSDTTRRPRTNNGILEQDGREYWFKTEDEFLSGLQGGAYLEAAIIHQQQVSGISISELQRAAQNGKIALSEIEPDGAAHIHSYASEKLFIFLLPPSFDVWMQRLRGRGEMSEAEVIRRLQSAQEEITAALREPYYQFVINNEVHEAAEAVDELAHGRTPNPAKQQKGRDHAEQLLIDVRLYVQAA